MFEFIYVEESITDHPFTRDIIARFSAATVISCGRYTEIFNRKSQNFRLQKRQPALILAEKYANFLLPAPDHYGIGSNRNFYFSHMLNCLYDCRYCFLQGMYRSAHYVLFVNYVDFENAIDRMSAENPGTTLHFFSGYDCDSLALEPVTGFIRYFMPVFEKNSNSIFEIRTKSTQVRSLMSIPVQDNVVVAWSFTPDGIAAALEHRTPAPGKRLQVMQRLQDRGWRLGLRFDPLIYTHDYQEQYARLFETIFRKLDISGLHSVSLGSFRLPREFFRTMRRLYPEEKLFASPLEDASGVITYKRKLHDEMLAYCRDRLLEYIPEEIFFPCEEIA